MQAPLPPLAALLQPHPWVLGQPPPSLPLEPAPPLVLLLPCRLPLAPETRDTLLASLSAEERQRHGTYRRPADQGRFLLARAGLRQLLGHWLGQPPALIALETDLQGKPHCPRAGAPAFNLSHSGDLILLAFHSRAAVGVDVEEARPHLLWEPIAERCLTPAEVAALRALPLAEQERAFLAAWCRLEARVKASGVGLGNHAAASPAGLRLWDVQVPEGYCAAVALLSVPRAPGEGGAGADHPSPPG